MIRYKISAHNLQALRLSLETEGRYNQNLKIKIDALSSSTNKLARLRAILSYIQPFNIRKFIRLLKKSDNSVEKLKGKKVFLVLGKTGSGKSTSIQYLAGSRMEKIITD